MKPVFLKPYILVLVVSALTGCAASLTPMQVSEKFWTAIQNQDAVTARKYIAEETIGTEDITGNILPVSGVSLGRTVIEGKNAWIDTSVDIAGDRPFSMSLETVLLQNDSGWLVDYDATVESISRGSGVARVISSLSDLSDEFYNKLDRSLDEIERSLPEIQREIETIEENIRQKLPELQRRLDDFMRQLEEALGSRKEDREQQQDPREI